MKYLSYFIGLSTLLVFLPITTYSQMQDVEWKTLPSPAVGTETISGDLSQLEITDDGNIYFIFFDENSNSLRIKHLDVMSGTWFEIHSEQISGVVFNQLETYQVQNNVFFTLVRQDTYTMYMWNLDPAQNVANLFFNQTTSMDQTLGMDFIVDKNSNLMYFASRDLNSTIYVDVFNLTSNSFENTNSLGYISYGKPEMAIDYTNNLFYVAGNNPAGDYIVHTSPLSVSTTFTPINAGGEITSGLITGNANGNRYKLNEKENSAPSIVLNQGTTGAESYRIGLPGTSFSDVLLEGLPGLEKFVVDGSGENDFILAQFPSQNILYVVEVLNDGTINYVANNNNPQLATLVTAGDAYAIAKAPNHSRVATFFHEPGNDGSQGGEFRLTNNEPTILNINELNGCTNQAGVIAKNIVFQDLDGDEVIITNNFTSSNSGVINAPSIVANQNALGHWSLGANPAGAGTTEITFDYTDGLDTLTATINITVTQPVTANFETTLIELCNNKNIVDFNDFVNEPGGSFNLQGLQSEDGSFNLESLNISAFPYNGSINYNFEDQNGCASSDNSNFVVYEAPSANLSVTNSSCGNNDGEITASVNSPNGNYDNYWNTGDQNTLTTSNLSPGTYYLNIIDEVGCIHVAQEDVIASDFAVAGNITQPSCFNEEDGAIEINVFGGSGNYNALWSTGHNTQNLTGLSAGNYQVIVTDSDGCQATKSFHLQNPDKFTVNYTVNSPDCGQANGAISLSSSSGGTTPYEFDWTTDQGPVTTQDLSAVEPGHFSVIVTDDNGCIATQNFQVNSNNSPMVSVEKIRKSLCGMSNGKIDISVTPSTGELITGIQWSNSATTEDINNLMPGTYECVVSQSNGCDAVYEYNVGTARPIKPEICIVTVDSTTNTNLVVWEKPTSNPFGIDYYNIYRETSDAHEFKKIDTVNHSSISVFNDVVASPANRSWRYRISAVNSCGVESGLSIPHKTIHLVMNEDNGDVNIIWDNYEGFAYNSYDLLRKTDDDVWAVIEPNIAYETLPFHSETPPTFDGLDYMIEVLPPNGSCSATEGKAQDYNAARSNKPTSSFNPGEGTGDPNNSLAKEENDSYSVAVYPNPSDGLLEVSVYQKNISTNLNLVVLDLNGRVIQDSKLNDGVNYLDLSNLDAGIYVLNVSDKDYSETFRIVIK
ncbi:MAG: hypothetical protein COA32_00910 [Fluviicola sp.]|nr:MAG: hypothetical protein COA32_00910 [Fluviicola sp.]